jgi:L-alanine-DL-glutamate epimerase-like enolase superfamily enzyme
MSDQTARADGASASSIAAEREASGIRAAVVPRAIGSLLERRFALPGAAGVAPMALSAFNVAPWDLIARNNGLPTAQGAIKRSRAAG